MTWLTRLRHYILSQPVPRPEDIRAHHHDWMSPHNSPWTPVASPPPTQLDYARLHAQYRQWIKQGPLYPDVEPKPQPIPRQAIGYKAITFTNDGFVSLLHLTPWQGRRLHATSIGCVHVSTEKAPHLRCLCGIHLVDSYEEAKSFADEHKDVPMVIVLIEGTGLCRRHERGWRCEDAQIMGIVGEAWEDDPPLWIAAKLHGVRIYPKRTAAQMVTKALLDTGPSDA